MDHHVKEFYQQFSDETPQGCFHKVIALHDAPDIDWEQVSTWVPSLCKGWYELAHLSPDDRISFIHEYWISKLPFRLSLSQFLDRFFNSLDDIGIYLSQRKFDDPFEANLVYSVRGNSGFFRGGPPASQKQIEELVKCFPDFILPDDYLAFFQIHNGFWKTTDTTGVMRTTQVPICYKSFQEMLDQGVPVCTAKGKIVDPKKLLPFYESFGMPYYQCFWGEWYPEQVMGNVYFSSQTWAISDTEQPGQDSENMSFPTFTDWLMFYLERID